MNKKKVNIITGILVMVLTSFVIPVSVYADKRVILATFGPAFLERKGDIKILYVTGDSYEMGYQHGWLLGEAYGEKVLHLYSLTITATAMLLGGGNFENGFTMMQFAKSLLAPYIPEELKIEMQGMADGLKDAWPESPLTYDDILLLNTHEDATAASWWHHFMGIIDLSQERDLEYWPGSPVESNSDWENNEVYEEYISEYIPGCSSFSMWGDATKDGSLIAAGTEDWFEFSTDAFGGLGHIWDTNIIFIAKPENGYAFAGTSATLLVGACQGWNEAGITVAQKTSSSIYETLRGWGDFIQCRMLIQYSGSINDAVELLCGEHHRTRGLNWEVTDAKVPLAAAIETSATEVAVRYGDTGDSLVSTNNYFCFPGFEGYEGHNMVKGQFLKGWGGVQTWPLDLTQWLSIVSNDQRYFTYKALIAENYGSIDVSDAKYFLTQCTGVREKNLMYTGVEFYKTGEIGDLYQQSMSVQRFVAKLGNGLNVWVSYGGTEPDTLGPWVHINLHHYFNSHRINGKK